ncbi:TRP-like ion channel Pkd2 [Cymbomonas tetramitiformis]|uniref:TRP-like ion channel Pkd2 n=1 Tax=Cymbomonas tetramitiformis TaxID=36881 RepID=A0AAE0GPJ1_9CHLO|nr:TRP-like ion channel Pkd2 [Cymbomonas tetramitiformis]
MPPTSRSNAYVQFMGKQIWRSKSYEVQEIQPSCSTSPETKAESQCHIDSNCDNYLDLEHSSGGAYGVPTPFQRNFLPPKDPAGSKFDFFKNLFYNSDDNTSSDNDLLLAGAATLQTVEEDGFLIQMVTELRKSASKVHPSSELPSYVQMPSRGETPSALGRSATTQAIRRLVILQNELSVRHHQLFWFALYVVFTLVIFCLQNPSTMYQVISSCENVFTPTVENNNFVLMHSPDAEIGFLGTNWLESKVEAIWPAESCGNGYCATPLEFPSFGAVGCQLVSPPPHVRPALLHRRRGCSAAPAARMLCCTGGAAAARACSAAPAADALLPAWRLCSTFGARLCCTGGVDALPAPAAWQSAHGVAAPICCTGGAAALLPGRGCSATGRVLLLHRRRRHLLLAPAREAALLHRRRGCSAAPATRLLCCTGAAARGCLLHRRRGCSAAPAARLLCCTGGAAALLHRRRGCSAAPAARMLCCIGGVAALSAAPARDALALAALLHRRRGCSAAPAAWLLCCTGGAAALLLLTARLLCCTGGVDAPAAWMLCCTGGVAALLHRRRGCSAAPVAACSAGLYATLAPVWGEACLLCALRLFCCRRYGKQSRNGHQTDSLNMQ